MTGRDYMTEVRAMIDAACTGTWSAPGVANSVVEDLRANDPELLAGFLDLCAVDVVRNLVNERDRSTRSYNRKTASRSVFREAAEKHEAGDTEPLEKLTYFLQELYVAADGTKVALKNMRGPELNFAADDFAQRARQSQLQEAFLRALAKKCGDRSVGELFTEDQVAALWLSVS
jgi:hypothetical protein